MKSHASVSGFKAARTCSLQRRMYRFCARQWLYQYGLSTALCGFYLARFRLTSRLMLEGLRSNTLAAFLRL